MYLFEFADDGEDDVVRPIEDLALVLLAESDSQRLEGLAASWGKYVRAFQLETLAMAVLPSCSYTLMSRSMTRSSDPTVRPLSRSWLLNWAATPTLESHSPTSASAPRFDIIIIPLPLKTTPTQPISLNTQNHRSINQASLRKHLIAQL